MLCLLNTLTHSHTHTHTHTLTHAHTQLYPQSPDSYHAGYSSLSPAQARDALARLHAHIPWDLARRYLLLLAPEPETFLTARARFATSLAAVSVCGYVAGVGDRHLENFLLDTRWVGLGYCCIGCGLVGGWFDARP